MRLRQFTIVKRKLREWIIRYLPAEIAGTICAMVAFWAAYNTTQSLVVAAIAGTLGENVGYYSVAAKREFTRHWQTHRTHPRRRRLRFATVHGLRDLVLEFGPAEIMDSFIVRPGLFYLLPLWFASNMALALLVAKVLADIIFYAFAVVGYEARKRFFSVKQAEPLATRQLP